MSVISVSTRGSIGDRVNKPVIGYFTLIELLVVVIIIGILAAIAIPVYFGVQHNAQHAATVVQQQTVKTGWVKVFQDDNDVYMRCHGTTLLYADGGNLAATANSPVCR